MKKSLKAFQCRGATECSLSKLSSAEELQNILSQSFPVPRSYRIFSLKAFQCRGATECSLSKRSSSEELQNVLSQSFPVPRSYRMFSLKAFQCRGATECSLSKRSSAEELQNVLSQKKGIGAGKANSWWILDSPVPYCHTNLEHW